MVSIVAPKDTAKWPIVDYIIVGLSQSIKSGMEIGGTKSASLIRISKGNTLFNAAGNRSVGTVEQVGKLTT